MRGSTNTRSPVRNPERLLLVLGMAGFLIAGLAIPAGLGRDGVALGLGYLLVVLVHAVLFVRVTKQILRIAPFNLASALLVIGAGFTDGVLTYLLWGAALVIQAAIPAGGAARAAGSSSGLRTSQSGTAP